jgi:hypothetical protein
VATQAEPVVISEIMYHPAGTNVLAEWFELHNPGPDVVSLAGWRVTKGVAFTFPTNATLAAGGFLVVAADTATFTALYPAVTNFAGGWGGTLSHDGEDLQLEDAQGNLVDRVAYAPAGDWALRRIGPPDKLNRRGWEWYAEHNGLGNSLELINSGLANDCGQNWDASNVPGGTPGAPNSIAQTNIAPLILDIVHTPLVPHSTDAVTITARLLDERTDGRSLTLQWRLDDTATFTALPMSDDGAHGDGLAGDGLYGAVLGPKTNGAIVEFYLTANDAEGLGRTYPKVQASGDARTANLVYQVDDSVYAGEQPVLRLILTQAEYNYLATQIWTGEPYSDAVVNGTFISSDGVLEDGATSQLRYQCDLRNRGHGTRSAVPHNFHVGFPKDRPWKGRYGLNLNTHYTHSQQIGSAVFRRLGIPMADSRPVQVRVNGANLAKAGQEQFGSYAANEVVDDRLAQRQFPLDPEGNLYRGIRDLVPGISAEADLAWHGPSFSSYTNAYAKENHAFANDWSDFIDLLDALNHAPDTSYVTQVTARVNVDQWMKYFAVNTLLDNQENSLGIGAGDDFALYRGTNDTRFQLLPYDMDSLMGRGLRDAPYRDGLWRMTNVAVIDRFMKRPEFVPFYFKHLKEFAETAFAPAQMNQVLDQLLKGYVDAATLLHLKTFNSNQVAYVLTQFPQSLTVAHALTNLNGYPRATTPTIALHGTGDAVQTRRVLVNGVPAPWTAWQATWTNASVALRPGLNPILVQALGVAETEVGRVTLEVWYDAVAPQTIGGALASDAVWTAAGGPYQLTNTLTINAGTTLTIEPGTTVYLGSGVDLVVTNGGRLLAEGTETAPIRFASVPGAANSWGGLIINGAVGSPETRLAYAHFDGNGATCIEVAGGTLSLDHATFGTTTHQYVSLDNSSFLLSHCHFPSSTAAFELLHGTGGIKTGGRGIIRDCYFGRTSGYNDIIDFTGGNRPSQAILQIYNNVFVGATDDILDLDGTDAWIAGNIFLHVHRNGAPDSSAAVSGGSSGSQTSEITISGNLFFDCDNAVTAKQGNFYTLLHNTIVHTTKTGGLDFDSGVVNVRDTTPELTTFGRGCYLEANIIVDAEQLVRNYDPAQSTVTFVNNLMPFSWTGPGNGNSRADPLLKHLPQVAEAAFATWEQAQVLRDWFSPLPGSPARGAGPHGRDLGGVVPLGVALSGEPQGTSRETTATLLVGLNRTGAGIPASGFPQGSGFTHYRWRLDAGDWSAETALGAPLLLTGLSQGPHQVEAIGRNDAGWFQNDPALGTNAVITASRVWTVDTNYIAPPEPPTVRLNEVLARNVSLFTSLGTTPDLIELHNYGSHTIELGGMGLTDNAEKPYKYTLPPNTKLAPGAFLVLAADTSAATPFLNTGFALRQSGDDLSLFDSPARGGALVDQVRFGVQVPGLSVGRLREEVWGLCEPTFGTDNLAQPTGDPRNLRINEWLADAQFIARNDFLELYNPDPLPVALGGLFLSDAAGAPTRHAIAPLSFIGAQNCVEFIADGDLGQGADHLNFKLSPDVGLILLMDADLSTIDAVSYSAQHTDISEGRSPNGADTFTRFTQPTPGGGNPGTALGECTLVTTKVDLLRLGAEWKYSQTANLDGTGWQLPGYNDDAWPSGDALLGVESSALPAPGLITKLTLGRTTYYFRTRFVVSTNLDGFNLNLTMVVDDGAVVYLNGTRLSTNGMSTATPTYATFAGRTVDNAVTEFFTVSASALVPGTNVLAAEVHQVNAGSSDIVWGLGLEAARTTTNCAPGAPLNLVLNEVLAANRTLTNLNGVPADFVELCNTGADTVSLAGLSLTDDSTFPGKFVFPQGASLAPGELLVVFCDGSQPVATTNTGFGLNAQGGAVFLFNTPTAGGNLVDAVHYGLQTADYAIARLPTGTGNWDLAVPTPGTPNAAAGLANASALCVNEWMADPARGNDWFELFNRASQPVALSGLALTDDLGNRTLAPLAPLSFIGTGPNGYVRFIADGNAETGPDHVGFSLKKSGEALGLFAPSGIMLDGLVFGPQSRGVSQGRFPDGAAAFTSFAATASPAAANYLPLPTVVINELLSHTDPPLEDALELHNLTADPVDIGGWFLSDTPEALQKFRIPDHTILPPHGWTVFYEADFNRGPAAFSFNSAQGGRAILSQADALGQLTGYRDAVKFGAALNGASFGRTPTSLGTDFTALTAHTFGEDNPLTLDQFRKGTGLPNAAPQVGPVVISEILYYSASGGRERPEDEFVELQNIAPVDVPLFDPVNPANAWSLRDAVSFTFPPGFALAPGARVVLVSFAPTDAALLATFRSRFNVPADVPVLGPWNGRLANDSDSVELVRPDTPQQPPAPDAGYVPQVLVDRVNYQAVSPWPAATTGNASLQRRELAAYGNEPTNWTASAPTPGRPNAGSSADSDGDLMDDAWEMAWFGTLNRDGTSDFDGDGMPDRAEFLAGTNPTNPADFLAFFSISSGNPVTLQFRAVAGRTYTVQYCDSLEGQGWSGLVNLPAQPASGPVTVTDANPAAAARFYRLVTPAQP